MRGTCESLGLEMGHRMALMIARIACGGYARSLLADLACEMYTIWRTQPMYYI